MSALTVAIDRAKLAKVLGLIDSPVDGEALAAARAAAQMVRGAGLTWSDVIAAPALPPRVREPVDDRAEPRDRADHHDGVPDREPIDITNAIEICLDYPSALSRWERGFVASLRFQRGLTAKQLLILERCARKSIEAGRVASKRSRAA
jgi:hypothetical protein